jgi:dipeptidase E
MPRQIFAMGGGVLLPDTGNFKLEEYIVRGSGVARPNIGFVPTASGDETGSIARFYDSYGRFDARLSVLTFFRRTPQDLAGYLAGLDVIHVGGGNTRSMLAVWRDWGLDLLLRDAYERGTLLCGSSAGSICWFAEGVTDSIAGELTTMSGLGILPGSNCPHYDGEKDRRPAYHRLVESGEIGDGIACDDGAGLHYIDGMLHAVASARPDSRAYRVARENGRAVETQLEVLQL